MIILSAVLLIFLGLVLLQKSHFMAMILGLVLIGNGINLSIFFASNPDVGKFAFTDNQGFVAASNDPLPQALVLTAIVIGFALIGFVVALSKRLVQDVGQFDSKAMKEENYAE